MAVLGARHDALMFMLLLLLLLLLWRARERSLCGPRENWPARHASLTRF